jgi:hypothetical protein
MCIAAIFTALVFVVTAYLHIPTNNGYIHVGDGLIYLAACILPLPYAMAVGAGGALLGGGCGGSGLGLGYGLCDFNGSGLCGQVDCGGGGLGGHLGDAGLDAVFTDGHIP